MAGFDRDKLIRSTTHSCLVFGCTCYGYGRSITAPTPTNTFPPTTTTTTTFNLKLRLRLDVVHHDGQHPIRLPSLANHTHDSGLARPPQTAPRSPLANRPSSLTYKDNKGRLDLLESLEMQYLQKVHVHRVEGISSGRPDARQKERKSSCQGSQLQGL